MASRRALAHLQWQSGLFEQVPIPDELAASLHGPGSNAAWEELGRIVQGLAGTEVVGGRLRATRTVARPAPDS